MSIAAIILAAGRGERAGAPQKIPKQYRLLGQEPVICHTVRCFVQHPAITIIILVIHPEDHQICEQTIAKFKEHLTIVEGGGTRQVSTLRGLHALKKFKPQYVHIHDGARPFITNQLLDKIHSTVNPQEGVLPVLPIPDTLKRVNSEHYVLETIPRPHLYSAQTPQCFPFESILAAHEKAKQACKKKFTDDSAIAEWSGIPMRTILGDPNNMKITWHQDFDTAHLYLQKKMQIFPDLRTGNGYDVHSFEEGTSLTLCGIEIPFHKKLNGHSDADVALHALTDALLATQGVGDIGTHFPPSDPQWKNASSEIFLRHALDIVKQAGGRIANIDITLIAEEPKIGPYRHTMTENLMRILTISSDRISIKATTNEKLGFIGRGEGIAAFATASVLYPGEIPK
ncbi:bifunctional 2-C-methyl-D-erythritol 4-phosphate cytidylyltransferase/2-C-methyl-D-erythritol 2,4-cyclodiphosphate synthase [Bartonella sp. 220]|uniref:bifunctional 2-C-methyl-D-erythritol 4-phosphate cytidylyltransferase/2-C-methyl-D-erythritol 2,4-cyclodiphosphate synthase n=1 Tax=Bartonella sp. 220B TaxID=2967260 RepID=UPI0022A8DC55|nr:bifunctional 2-C-methyl-D-erythritol 4-phosphate cytidylyltransferase/2-C-methyl-D-erythritol 2,4-cyclodiphosphate synthase [Bartonella sp. 220B]MCZ2158239.1 bifunctional 2-C-methyl-D-erythritol 4-phosphate cytidylyltransferase/2-C-methyl-D-erythritol 2,4-cyclodiphosphate synthase [Bartonella sp. 220B]